MKKVMVIGINPEYNYPGEFEEWKKNTTYFASNLGASLVSRTILKMFDADFIDNFNKIKEYKNQYELCILAFTNHATDWRDVSRYADFIEQMDIPTALFSLGVQDYSSGAGSVGPLHTSLKRILNHVTNTTGYIGVRGFHTASLLYKEGYNNVIPIGCPSLYYGMDRNLSIKKPKDFSHPVFVFHRTFADVSSNIIENIPLLGQDFLDEAVFTENHPNDSLRLKEKNRFYEHKFGGEVLDAIEKKGLFYNNFEEWFNEIRKADFVFGPRLHGCISGIINGSPSLLIARDIRVREIAAFFKIPVINYEDYKGQSLKKLYDNLDYSSFNKLYPKRYDNFIGFLSETNILKYYQKKETPKEINFSYDDLQEHRVCLYQKIDNLNSRLAKLEKNIGMKSFLTLDPIYRNGRSKVGSLIRKIKPRK